MIVPWLKETSAYSLRQDHRQPKIIIGDLTQFRRLRRAMASAHPETHLAISYAYEDHPSFADLIADTHALVEAMTGLPFAALCLLAITHREALPNEIGDPRKVRETQFRWATHIHILNLDLRTGQRIDAYYAPRDWERLREWTRERNTLQGYKCPYAAENRRPRPISEEEAEALARRLRSVCLDALSDEPSLTPRQLADIVHTIAPGAKVRADDRGEKLTAKIKAPRVRGVIHLNYDRKKDALKVERRTRTVPVGDQDGERRRARATDNSVPRHAAPADNRTAPQPTERTHGRTQEGRPTVGADHHHPRKPLAQNSRVRDDSDAPRRVPDEEVIYDPTNRKARTTRSRRIAEANRPHRATPHALGKRTRGPRSATGNAEIDRSLGSLLRDAVKIAAELIPGASPEITLTP